MIDFKQVISESGKQAHEIFDFDLMFDFSVNKNGNWIYREGHNRYEFKAVTIFDYNGEAYALNVDCDLSVSARLNEEFGGIPYYEFYQTEFVNLPLLSTYHDDSEKNIEFKNFDYLTNLIYEKALIKMGANFN